MVLAIEAAGLAQRIGGRDLVQGLDLAVPQGARHGLLGANGAGKTTTMRMLATLLAPTGGRARVLGRDVAREPLAVRALVGYVGDDGASACPSWSAREYVAYFARLRGTSDARSVAERALDDVRLEKAARDRALARLSVGMRRRVELARGLLGSPRVLLLDEPTRGLDLPAKHETWGLLRRLRDERNATLLVSSHEPEEIRALCDDVTLLARGRVVHRGAVAALAEEEGGLEGALLRRLAVSPRGL